MAEFPSDRFDGPASDTARVGAHRAPVSSSRRWVILAWSAGATVALTVLGLFALQLIDRGLDLGVPPVFVAPASDPEPAVTAVTDPSTVQLREGFSITVLDATGVAGTGRAKSSLLTDAGWPVGTETRADQEGLETTVIYYADPADEAIARGMVELLGVGTIAASDAFPGAAITIVVGLDAVV
jgi:hypothetical protein